MTRLNFALNKGYTVRVSKQLAVGHRGVEVRYLYAPSLEAAFKLRSEYEAPYVLVDILQPNGKWIK